jgi:hypothetical protein
LNITVCSGRVISVVLDDEATVIKSGGQAFGDTLPHGVDYIKDVMDASKTPFRRLRQHTSNDKQTN